MLQIVNMVGAVKNTLAQPELDLSQFGASLKSYIKNSVCKANNIWLFSHFVIAIESYGQMGGNKIQPFYFCQIVILNVPQQT